MKIKIISQRKTKIDDLTSLKSIIEKKVLSKSGDKVGIVKDVFFSGDDIEGIIVRKGFSKIFIDLDYVTVSKDNIMLSIDPAIMLKGKLVFDADGKKLGKVIKVNRKGDTNNLDSLIIKRKIYTKPVKIPKEDISVLKKNIILRKVYE